MWQFVLGFGTGVYVGTYFDCKPILNKIQKLVQSNCPPKKKEESKKDGKDKQ